MRDLIFGILLWGGCLYDQYIILPWKKVVSKFQKKDPDVKHIIERMNKRITDDKEYMKAFGFDDWQPPKKD